MFLANPIVIPFYATLEFYVIVIMAFIAEIVTVRTTLRGYGVAIDGITKVLVELNACTFIPFVWTLALLDRYQIGRPSVIVPLLELLVVVVEGAVIRRIIKQRAKPIDTGLGTLTRTQSFVVSFAGNVASVVIGFIVGVVLLR